MAKTRIKPNILIVDDEISIRITLSEFLKDEGFNVEITENVESAMSFLSKHKFDVVVTDIIMPKFSGIKFLEIIKENYPETQVILMTGEPTIETASVAVRTDALDYITKPVTKTDIIEVVTKAVQLKKIEDDKRHLLEKNKQYQDDLEHIVDSTTTDLEESQAHFKAISESASDAIISINEKGKVIFINKATEIMFGITKNDLIGQKISNIIPRRYWKDQQDGILSLLNDQSQHMIGNTIVIHGIRNSSQEFPIEVSLSAWTVKEKKYISVIIRDISSRKAAEEKLRRYKEIVSSSTDMLAYIDPDFRYRAVNSSYCKALNKPIDQIIGKTNAQLFGKDVFEKHLKTNFERCLAGEQVKFFIWYDFPSNGRRYIEINYSPYYDENNTVAGIIANGRDSTEMRKKTQELERSQKILIDTGRIAEVGGWEVNLETMETFLTEESFNIHGLSEPVPPTLEEGIQYYSLESQPIIEQAVNNAIEKGEPYDLELKFIQSNGNEIWVRTSGELQSTEEGGKKLIGSIQNITQKKEAEENIKQQYRFIEAQKDLDWM